MRRRRGVAAGGSIASSLPLAKPSDDDMWTIASRASIEGRKTAPIAWFAWFADFSRKALS